MKRILEKRQIQVILLLSAVLFILACGVAYTLSTRAVETTGGGGEVEKPPHSLVRDARVSANERIEWETNFGGSGDETPVSVFEKNDEIYIFGNTDSSDLDFAGAAAGKTRGYGARLSSAGRTLSYTVFDFTIAKVLPTAAGFAVAGNEGSVAGLYLLTDALTLAEKTAMPSLHVLSASNLYVYDNRYFLFAESYDELTGVTSLLLHVYTSGLSLEREKLFSHSYSLKLLDMMPYGDGYILAAAATFQDLGLLTIARFGTLSQPAFTDIDLGHAYTPTAFMPLGSGFAAICDRDGNAELLLLGENLVKTDVRFLTETPNAHSKTLFYAGAPYAYDGEKLLQLGDDGRIVGSIAFAVRQITDFCSNGVAAFVVGADANGIQIAFLGKQKSEVLSLSVSEASHMLLCAGADSLLLTADTHATGGDCGNCFGGSDVWVSKLRL